MFCSNCGAEGQGNYCTKCGKKLLEVGFATEEKRPVVEENNVNVRRNTRIVKRYGVISSFLLATTGVMGVMFFGAAGGESPEMILIAMIFPWVYAIPGLIMIFTRTPKGEIGKTIIHSCIEGIKAWIKLISSMFLVGLLINMNIGCKDFTAIVDGKKISVKKTFVQGYGNIDVYVDNEGNYYCS